MKTLLLCVLCVLCGHHSLAAPAPGEWLGHYTGALWSTHCPVKVGAGVTLDVSLNGTVTMTITDDGQSQTVNGPLLDRGRFHLVSSDGQTVLNGIIRFYNHDRDIIFTGTGKDQCTYKFQGHFRHF